MAAVLLTLGTGEAMEASGAAEATGTITTPAAGVGPAGTQT